MRFPLPRYASWTAIVVFPAMACAAGFDVRLEVTGAERHAAAPTTRPTTGEMHAPRKQLTINPGADLVVTWNITATGKQTDEDVLVHIYVVRADRTGQAPPALDPKRVLLESALTMDFPPGERCSGQHPFHVAEPGVYLLRVEVRPGGERVAPDEHDVAELDLVVKPAQGGATRP